MSLKCRPLRSPIWTFFTKDVISDSYIAICNICKQRLSYKTTTSNLRKHMSFKHPTVTISVPTPEMFISTEEIDRATEDDVVVQPPKMPKFSAASSKLEAFKFGASSNKIASRSEKETITSLPGSSHTPLDNSAFLVSTISSEHHVSVSSKSTWKKPGQSQQQLLDFVPKKISATQKKNIDQAFLKLFTKDFQPFSIVEDEGFMAFTKAMNPSYTPPHRKSISKSLIPAMFAERLTDIRQIVERSISICLTTDCWTSLNMESFMAVTGHFINSDMELQSVLLQCEALPGSHTAENLASSLREVVNMWNLEGKVVFLVSDNASNIIKAAEILKLNNLGCFAHSLNLIVKDGLKINPQISDLLEKVKNVVSHFKRSSTSNEKLLEYQRKNNNPNNLPKKLLQEVPTRWNSTYLMLRRLLVLEEPLKATVALLGKNIPVLTTDDWVIISELVTCLKPFFVVTKSVSAEKYATASLAVPLSNSLLSVCKKLQSKNLSAEVKDVVDCLHNGVVHRFSHFETNETLTLTTFIDPRYKNLVFSSQEVGEKVKKRVVNMVANRMRLAETTSSQTENSHEVERNDSAKKMDELSVFFYLDERLAKKKKKGTNLSRAIIEVDRFLEDEEINRKDDPIEWWKTQGHNYPFLRQIFAKYFCCMVTSVPCERVFSSAGRLITERRTRLSSSKVKMLMFLNQNEPASKKRRKLTLDSDEDEEHCLSITSNI